MSIHIEKDAEIASLLKALGLAQAALAEALEWDWLSLESDIEAFGIDEVKITMPYPIIARQRILDASTTISAALSPT